MSKYWTIEFMVGMDEAFITAACFRLLMLASGGGKRGKEFKKVAFKFLQSVFLKAFQDLQFFFFSFFSGLNKLLSCCAKLLVNIMSCISEKIRKSKNGATALVLLSWFFCIKVLYLYWISHSHNITIIYFFFPHTSTLLHGSYLLSGAQGSPSSWADCWQSLFPWPEGPRWCHLSTAKTETFAYYIAKLFHVFLEFCGIWILIKNKVSSVYVNTHIPKLCGPSIDAVHYGAAGCDSGPHLHKSKEESFNVMLITQSPGDLDIK